MLHWNAVVYGVPGAGYVARGHTGRGPVARMLRREQLRQLDPALVIVQAGHDDLGVPAALERSRVAATVRMIRATVPGARIALLTAFGVGVDGTATLRGTDAVIVSAGLAADPGAVIMDPVGSRWQFARADGGLHPTADGDTWIARTAARRLVAAGVRAAGTAGPAPVICDLSVGAGQPVIA
jgi:lysophospholipase L1-like esterase